MKTIIAILEKRNACRPALDWLETQPDWHTAWNNCSNPDWLLWIIVALEIRFDQVEYNCVHRLAIAEFDDAMVQVKSAHSHWTLSGYNDAANLDFSYSNSFKNAVSKYCQALIVEIRRRISAEVAERAILDSQND